MRGQAYYNEIDPKAAAWLRELIRQGLIAPGDVDERSIVDVQPDDLRGYVQCHFFAGIGGWSYALRLAGWPDERPVWTGSCPCQPFSCAGKGKGTADSRHLWPEFYRLIKACRPAKVFGEQVASAEVVGTELEASFVVAVQRGDFARANKLAKRLAHSHRFHFSPRWVDGVRADLEAADYAFRFTVLGAHSVCAPHIRQRLYWMADAELQHAGTGIERIEGYEGIGRDRTAIDGGDGGMAHTGDDRLQRRIQGREDTERQAIDRPARHSGADRWADFYLVHCRDGKTRRIESCITPLAHGVPARVVRLRGYGNAIVPQVAAQFVLAAEEAIGGL